MKGKIVFGSRLRRRPPVPHPAPCRLGDFDTFACEGCSQKVTSLLIWTFAYTVRIPCFSVSDHMEVKMSLPGSREQKYGSPAAPRMIARRSGRKREGSGMTIISPGSSRRPSPHWIPNRCGPPTEERFSAPLAVADASSGPR